MASSFPIIEQLCGPENKADLSGKSEEDRPVGGGTQAYPSHSLSACGAYCPVLYSGLKVF